MQREERENDKNCRKMVHFLESELFRFGSLWWLSWCEYGHQLPSRMINSATLERLIAEYLMTLNLRWCGNRYEIHDETVYSILLSIQRMLIIFYKTLTDRVIKQIQRCDLGMYLICPPHEKKSCSPSRRTVSVISQMKKVEKFAFFSCHSSSPSIFWSK